MGHGGETFFAAADRVFFVGGAGEGEEALVWTSDGTAAGTAPVSSDSGALLRPLYGILEVGILTVGERGYFRADDGGGPALWASDGGAAVRLFPRSVMMLGGVGGALLFTPDGEGALWKSDGTAAGTVKVLDGSGPHWRPEIGVGHRGRLYFTAWDGAHGRELWASDGTAAGTGLVADLRPGPDGSFLQSMTSAGDTLFFAAFDGTHGRELWALQPPCGSRGPDVLCLAGGRFRIEVAWRDFAGATGPGRALPVNDESGAFWFFSAANVELLVKVLDGRLLNGHWWLFHGSLSNVAFELTVTDLVTGRARRYANPPGVFASAGDVTAFPGP